MQSNNTSSNNSVLYLFLLSLFVSFFVILLFSQSTNKALTSSDIGDPTFLASVYIPINFEEEIKEEPVVIIPPKVEVAKTKQLPIKMASKNVEKKAHVVEVTRVIPQVISTPIPVRKKSAVMSYAISSYKAPIVTQREIVRPKPQVVYEKPRITYERPKKQSKPDTSNLEREIQALAMKKLEKEISGK